MAHVRVSLAAVSRDPVASFFLAFDAAGIGFLVEVPAF